MSADTVDLTVDAIATGGSGVARDPDGRVVFVPGTAPGDRIRAELVERRKRWARGRVVELYEPGPARVEPACRLFGTCGGCRVMHLERSVQLEALRQGVEDALRRIGGAEVSVDPMVAGERALGYRNRATFTLRRRGDRVYAGYHAMTGRRIVEVERCPLVEPPVARAWTALRGAWGRGARYLPPGGELRLTVRAGLDDAVGLLVEGGEAGSSSEEDLAAGAARIADAIEGLASYWWAPADDPPRVLAGGPELPDRWFGIDLALRPRAFVQVNREIAERIERHLDEGLGAPGGVRILDLYAGVGLRAIRWSAAGASVVSIESDGDAVATAREAARGMETPPELIEATVEEALDGAARGGADTVVVNPPRAGLGEEAANLLRGVDAARLVYVSCDPATLARDVARLAGAWRPVRATPFDAFPQTGHVETVAWFERVGGGDA